MIENIFLFLGQERGQTERDSILYIGWQWRNLNTKRIRSSRLGLQQEARNFFAAGFNTTMRNLQCIHIGDRMVIVHLPTTLRDVPIYGLL